MKTKISALIIMFLMSVGVNAQIDRSKQPEPGPAPKITLEAPGEFQLKNGLTVLVVENHKLPRVSYSLRIDNNPETEGDKAGVSSLLGAMLGNGTASIPKDDFNEEIDFLGANLTFGSQSAFASSLSKYSDRIIELLADAAINPLLIEEEFQKEKDKLIEGLKTTEKSVQAVADRVSSALSYGVNHPYGEFISEASINNIALSDVLAHYETNFNPKNAYLVVIGDVDATEVKASIEKYFGAWNNKAGVQVKILQPSANTQYAQINLVDMPNAVQSNIILTNNVNLKMGDEDYHSALIANYILGGGATGYLFQNLRDDKAYTYGSYSRIGASRYGASRFLAKAEVRNAVTDSSVVEILREVERIRTEPVSAETLKAAKAAYAGSFVMALEKPQTIASYALNIKLNNLPEDYYKNYLKNINDVTVEDVQQAANKFFQKDNARIIVVGKGSDVLTNLEKTGIPIKYFDKYAKPTEKAEYSKPIPDGVTAKSVMEAYIKAIGGRDKVSQVNTTLSTADVTIEGAPFSPKAVVKTMSPNKISMEMSIEGMGTIMKQKFDGQSGYQEQQGRKIPMSEKEIDAKKAQKALFPELNYDSAELALESKTTIEGVDVYKVKVTKGDEAALRFYDVNTGLLVRTEKVTEAQGQQITTIEDLSNYSPVNGVLFPYTLKVKAGPQVIVLKINNVKVNEGVTEADFN